MHLHLVFQAYKYKPNAIKSRNIKKLKKNVQS